MTKLTITGRAETILGILQKLEICDAQWNVNEGFTVALDTTDPESDADSTKAVSSAKTSPRKPGRKKKETESEESQEQHARKGITKTCKLCGETFTAKGGNTRYCPNCKGMHGDRCSEIEANMANS